MIDEYAVPPSSRRGYEFGDIVDGRGVPVTGNHTYTPKDT